MVRPLGARRIALLQTAARRQNHRRLGPHNAYASWRRLPSVRPLLLVPVLLLAGCAGTPLDLPSGQETFTGLPVKWAVDAEGCFTTATFFLVDQNRTREYLPPGFHAGDLSGFLYHTAVTSGRVPAFVATSTCERFNATNPETSELREGSLEIVYLGFYVLPPEFSRAYANKPSDYNFYVVSYVAPLRGGADGTEVPVDIVKMYGWAHKDGELTMQVERHAGEAPSGHPLLSETTKGTAAPDQAEVLSGEGVVRMDGASAFEFSARAFFPQAFEEPPSLRFWQAAPPGIGFLEFGLGNRTVMAGPLDRCVVAPNNIIADIVGVHGGGEADGRPCGATDSFALVFDRHSLQGQFHHMEGVHPI